MCRWKIKISLILTDVVDAIGWGTTNGANGRCPARVRITG